MGLLVGAGVVQTSLIPDEQFCDLMADALSSRGYVVLPNALPDSLVEGLYQRLHSLGDDDFKRAGIGRQDDFQIDTSIRRDRIHWLQQDDPAEIRFLHWMNGLRLALNRRLFLGLFDFECHFATYAVGAFYKKHLDAFKRSSPLPQAPIQVLPLQAQPTRMLSTVLYLNPDWQQGDGGELLIYDEADALLLESIAPEYGKLVIFLSEQFPHEVAVAKRERHSIAGWFRINGAC